MAPGASLDVLSDLLFEVIDNWAHSPEAELDLFPVTLVILGPESFVTWGDMALIFWNLIRIIILSVKS